MHLEVFVDVPLAIRVNLLPHCMPARSVHGLGPEHLMNWFPPLSLGTRVPDRLHGVSCSLPTMRDVIGYEKKDVATMGKLTSGYPRFVVHPLLLKVEAALRARCKLGGEALWMTSSNRMAEELASHIASGTECVVEHDGIFAVAHADDLELRKTARSFLQHAGGFLSSREAEDYAARNGLANGVEHEDLFEGDAPMHIKETLAGILGIKSADNVLLAPSGMNAFWGAFSAVSEIQRPKGRDTWLQIGWLYLDTAAILAKFTGERHVRILNVNDREAIERAFREHGPRLAGVVTEITTNPLMQTPDLENLATLARENGAYMLVDPTISSPCNVDVLRHSDIVLNSLTKYAASEGDVIAGAVAIAPHCPDSENVRVAIAEQLEPLYARDAARLALEIDGVEQLVAQLNVNARAVIDYLRNRKTGVKRLYWSLQDGSRDNYLRLARNQDCIGPVFSFEVEGPMNRFYDALSIAKGPSFGIRTSILMPYVYLAHYDLITSEDGRALLAKAGLPPDLMRLSVGAEPAEATIDALEMGFAAAGFA